MSDQPSVHELVTDLIPADEPDRFSDPLEARKKAMDYLARREHAAGELRQKLVKAGYDAVTAADAIETLRADGLQSDRRFAEALVHSRVNQGKGPVRIRADLCDRGVSDTLGEEVLAEADADFRALAIEARRRKFGESEPADFKEKARQMRFLQYRGFESDQIQAAVSGSD